MANTHTTLSELFTDIANAIRNKNNTTDTIIADDFPAEISKLKSGFDYINNTVTILPDSAFINDSNLNHIELSSITSIGAHAFENCQNLYIATLPDTLTSIGENAFNDCPELVIFSKHSSQPDTWNTNWNPDNRPVIYGDPVETWDISATENDNVIAELYPDGNMYTLVIRGKGAIEEYRAEGNWDSPWSENYRSLIKTVVVLSGITHIGRIIFGFHNNLTKVFLANTIKTMGDFVFWDCTNLTEITIPKSVNNIDENLFPGCSSLITINVENDNPSYISINGHLYSKDKKTLIAAAQGQSNLQINDTTKIIGIQACREYEKLTSITIPDSVEVLNSGCFYGCSNLTTVTLSKNLKKIYGAFGNCYNLTAINIPEYVHYISNGSFSGCSNLKIITVHENNTYFKAVDNVLYDKNQTKLIQVAGNKTNITIPDGVIEIASGAMDGCAKLNNFIIPNSVKTIGSFCFNNCTSLTNIIIPNGITNLSRCLFQNCHGLKTITIPNTVKTIDGSLWGCTSLTTINFTGTMAEWNAITKDDDWNYNTGNYTIYCIDGNIPKAS